MFKTAELKSKGTRKLTMADVDYQRLHRCLHFCLTELCCVWVALVAEPSPPESGCTGVLVGSPVYAHILSRTQHTVFYGALSLSHKHIHWRFNRCVNYGSNFGRGDTKQNLREGVLEGEKRKGE